MGEGGSSSFFFLFSLAEDFGFQRLGTGQISFSVVVQPVRNEGQELRCSVEGEFQVQTWELFNKASRLGLLGGHGCWFIAFLLAGFLHDCGSADKKQRRGRLCWTCSAQSLKP